MLDINHIRAELARELADTASHRHSLDAAVMHVVEIAYRRGLEDGRAEMSARDVSNDNLTGWTS